MSPIQAFNPPDSKSSAPLSRAVRAGDFIFIGGMGIDFEDSQEAAEQAFRSLFEKLKKLFDDIGITYKDIVKVTAYLSDSHRFHKTWNKVYGEFFSEPYPARATLPIIQEGGKTLGCEVEMVAYVGK